MCRANAFGALPNYLLIQYCGAWVLHTYLNDKVRTYQIQIR
jgi:hypothetical protein